MAEATQFLFKGESEVVDRFFDFSAREEIASEKQKITSAVVTEILVGSADPATTLTIGSPSVNVAGTIVTVQLSGGLSPKTYHLKCSAVTDGGKTLTMLGKLQVVAA